MEGVKISQKEYLKKYLSSGDSTKKKKKKKLIKIGPKKVKIIDDDIDLKNLRPLEDGEFDIFNSTEDAPQIAGIIDERGPIDFSDKTRWKIIADDGEGNIAITSSNDRRDGVHDKEVSRDKTEENSRKPSSIKGKSSNISNHDESDQDLCRKSRKLSDENSPPSKKSSKHKKVSKKRRRKASTSHDSNSDTSTSSESEKERKSKLKKRRDKTRKSRVYDSDLSPPRPSRKRDSREKREFSRRRDEDSDLSPPRFSSLSRKQMKRQRDSERRRRDEDSDLSPPRSSHSKSKYK